MAYPVAEAIEDMLAAIERAQGYAAEAGGLEAYSRDAKLKDATERTLLIISEASKRIPARYKAKHNAIPWADVRDIGNVLRHEYQNIVDQIIWQTVTVELPKLQAVLIEIKAELEGDKPAG